MKKSSDRKGYGKTFEQKICISDESRSNTKDEWNQLE